MNQVTRKRVYGDTQTDGTISYTYNNKTITFPCSELAWNNNEPFVSCIPPAPGDAPVSILCKWAEMKDHPGHWHYELQNVEGRSGCFIHYMDMTKPAKGQLEGCMAGSEGNVALFEAAMGKQDFMLLISG